MTKSIRWIFLLFFCRLHFICSISWIRRKLCPQHFLQEINHLWNKQQQKTPWEFHPILQYLLSEFPIFRFLERQALRFGKIRFLGKDYSCSCTAYRLFPVLEINNKKWIDQFLTACRIEHHFNQKECLASNFGYYNFPENKKKYLKFQNLYFTKTLNI